MKLIPSAVMSVAVLAGLAGSAVAYQAASAPPDGRAPQQVVQVTPAEAAAAPAKERVRFAPCKRSAHLEKGVCVTDVVRTVVLPAAPAAPAAPAPMPAAPAAGSDEPGDETDEPGDETDEPGDETGEDEDHADHGDDD